MMIFFVAYFGNGVSARCLRLLGPGVIAVPVLIIADFSNLFSYSDEVGYSSSVLTCYTELRKNLTRCDLVDLNITSPLSLDKDLKVEMARLAI